MFRKGEKYMIITIDGPDGSDAKRIVYADDKIEVAQAFEYMADLMDKGYMIEVIEFGTTIFSSAEF